MSERPGSADGAAIARQARWAVTIYFVVTGAGLATWTARIPAVKQRLDLDGAEVTLALFAVAAGSVLAMQVVGHLTDRFGSARIMAPAGVLMSLSLVVPGYAGSVPVLVLGLLLFGVGHGMVDVAMNVHGVQVERRYGRPIMSTFHAMFSVGGLLGAGLGALAAQLGLSAATHFVLVGAALAALSVTARPALLRVQPQHTDSAERGGRGIPPAVIFLGMLGFFCALGEGSVADWSPLYLHDELHTSPAVAPLGFAVFSTAMAAFRFLGDRLALRFGPVALVRCCGLIAGAGMSIGLLMRHPVAAIVGFGLFGIGLSCIVPQVFSAAGRRDPQRSGRDLAQVSTLAYGGLLAGPVIIGLISYGFGLSLALGVPALLALFVAVAANAVRPPSTRGQQADAQGQPAHE